MSPLSFGLLAGVAFGALAAASMLPLKFADKRAALSAAFCSRFAIGFLIPLCALPVPHFVAGGIIGLLISLPDALVTKAYPPILGLGIVGGMLIGWLSGIYVA